MLQGDSETLKKYCSAEVIERCKAEHRAYESQGIFFDNKVRIYRQNTILLLRNLFLTVVVCTSVN